MNDIFLETDTTECNISIIFYPVEPNIYIGNEQIECMEWNVDITIKEFIETLNKMKATSN